MTQLNIPIFTDPPQNAGADGLTSADPVVAEALGLIYGLDHVELAGFTVEGLARRIPVTRRTLDRRFSASAGITVLEVVNRQRLQRAKDLLLQTDLPIKAVVYRSGFSSKERMRVVFLEEVGMTPREFRAAGCQ